jgi:hypothetical protein
MFKTLLFSIVILVSFSFNSYAETYTCQGKDLKVSLTRSRQSPTSYGDITLYYPKASTLTISCKGQNPLVLRASSSLAPTMHSAGYNTDSNIWSLADNLIDFVKTYFENEEAKQERDVQKEYLAILLTAKTNNLPVTISYDAKSDLNIRNQYTILDVTIE